MNILQRTCASWLAAAIVLALAGCGSSGGYTGGDIFTRAGNRTENDGGLVARMASRGSAATGTVRVYDYRDGVQVQLAMSNLMPGNYRLAIHESGNCSSPNLFSVGPAWAPPVWTKPAADLLPGFTAGEEGTVVGYVAFIKGVSTDSRGMLEGRSFVIHWGDRVGEAFPGQPNNRMACGKIVEGKALF